MTTDPVQNPTRHYRNVLGHFPTGVAVVTAVSDDGTPTGMVVGSFTAVSLDPPLVAFLPDKGSSTFPAIRASGAYCVNVLGGEQEDLCRRFATKGADRFSGTPWHPAPGSGSPVLDGAVAWIDCQIEDVHEAGDHLIVIGRVLDLDVHTPALPLLFFQGGYGTFAPRSLVLATRGRLTEAVRMADAARQDLERLAEQVGLECRVFAHEEGQVQIVATAGYAGGIDPVGAMLPFFPPFGYTIAAWGSSETRQTWFDAHPADLTPTDRSVMDTTLDGIRRAGWGLSFASPAAREAQDVVEAMARFGPTPDLARQLNAVGKRMTRLDDPAQLDAHTAASVRTVTAPVMGPNGPVLHPTLYGFPEGSDLAFVERARDALVATCESLSRRFTGTTA